MFVFLFLNKISPPLDTEEFEKVAIQLGKGISAECLIGSIGDNLEILAAGSEKDAFQLLSKHLSLKSVEANEVLTEIRASSSLGSEQRWTYEFFVTLLDYKGPEPIKSLKMRVRTFLSLIFGLAGADQPNKFITDMMDGFIEAHINDIPKLTLAVKLYLSNPNTTQPKLQKKLVCMPQS